MIIEKLNNIEYRKINDLAPPLILNNVAALIIGLCDDAMAGRISVGAFAAIGIITSTINSITGVVGASSVAFNIIGGRCYGRGDKEKLYDNMLFNIAYSILIGAVFFILFLLFGSFMLRHIYNYSGKLLQEAAQYLHIFSISIGLNMLLFTFSSYMKIIGKTKYILYGNVTSSILNVVFDYSLIFGHFGMPKLGLKGNAIGSILAFTINLAIYVKVTGVHRLLLSRWRTFLKTASETMRITIPLMAQEFLESTLMVVAMNSMLSSIGVLQVSVYNLLASVINIALMPMYAYSQASLTIISRNTGTKERTGIVSTAAKCLFMAWCFYSIIGVFIIIFRNYIPMIITDYKKLMLGAAVFMPAVVAVNFMNIPNSVFKYSLQAIGDEKWVFLASLFINTFSLLLIGCLIILLHMGLCGMYLGIFISYLILSLVFVVRLNRKVFI